MSETLGPLGLKFRFLARWIDSRADLGRELSATEARTIARVVRGLLPLIDGLEQCTILLEKTGEPNSE